jgi:hypothetical protein
MNTAVWTFLIIVTIFSFIGFVGLKYISEILTKRKTEKLISQFREESPVETSNKSFQEVEKELKNKDAHKNKKEG